MRLRSGSPCIDAGDNAAVPLGITTDLDGNLRRVDDPCASDTGRGTGPVVDMGAFELPVLPGCGDGICDLGESCESCTCDCGDCCGDGVCAVHENCLSCAADCSCLILHVPGNYGLIQEAIEAAKDGDEIVVGPGRYCEAIDFLGKAIAVKSSDGPRVTTIDATGINTSVVTCCGGEEPESVLEGFSITGGSAQWGGGMRNSHSSPTVTNCTFSGNNADIGGGMYNSYSSPTVTGCAFSRNTAYTGGGGVSNEAYCNPAVTRCTFSENTVGYYGGGMYNDALSNPHVTNCAFSKNKSKWGGGGMYNDQYSSPTVTNCTFSRNSSGPYRDGGGLYNNYNSSPTLANCIFWGNQPNQISQIAGSVAAISYSDIEGGWIGVGNIDADPAFLDAYRGDLRLMSGSPCIDAGDNAAVPDGISTDLDGNMRRVDDPCANDTGRGTVPAVDMGAFELPVPPGCGDGVCGPVESCEVCACDCGGCCGDRVCGVHEDCLSCAADCSCLMLNVPGDYGLIQDAIQAARNGDEIIISPGTYYEAIDLLGKTITVRSSDGPRVTTIDGTGLDTSVVTCKWGEGPATRIEGLTITGGNALHGGGMYTEFYSSPTVSNCKFTKNAASYGGGMYNSGSTPTVIDCAFVGNTASTVGGGMHNDHYSSPTVTNCAFVGNTAGAGGGIYNYDSSLALTTSTFSGNVAIGGVGGGAMFNYRSSAMLTDSILWGNYPNQITNNTSNNVTVSFSNVEGHWSGAGNIAVDPLFVPGPSGCFYLSQVAAGRTTDSPCLDAGSDTAANLGLNRLTTRSDEGIDTGRVDMGYHYPVTGLPLVMGDFNRNQRDDLSDFAEWEPCMSGPVDATVSPCCRIFDFELDGDVDLADYAAFESAFSIP